MSCRNDGMSLPERFACFFGSKLCNLFKHYKIAYFSEYSVPYYIAYCK